MRFNPRARLDSSQVRLRGRGGGGRVAVGGGAGIVGVLIVLAMQFLGGGGGDVAQILEQLNGTSVGGASTAEQIEGCETGADAQADTDGECGIVAVVNSIQGYWSQELGDRYELAATNFFRGGVTTGGCGSASSSVGPFYCPADQQVYLDLEFFAVLEDRLGAGEGDFVEAYVLAHEYGHHVQTLLGIGPDSRETGAESDLVRQELQADCFAGVWTHHAATVPDAQTGEILILELDDDDIREAMNAAKAVGDDTIQESSGQQVNPDGWTHGSSEQRQRWFMTGYDSGDPDRCDTFSADNL